VLLIGCHLRGDTETAPAPGTWEPLRRALGKKLASHPSLSVRKKEAGGAEGSRHGLNSGSPESDAHQGVTAVWNAASAFLPWMEEEEDGTVHLLNLPDYVCWPLSLLVFSLCPGVRRSEEGLPRAQLGQLG
jgi:hypothetical protein